MANKTKFAAALALMVAGLLLAAIPLLAQDTDDGPLENEVVTVSSGNSSWLGVHTKDLTSEEVRDMKPGDEYGAAVDEIESGSPAAKAGLQKGDVIVEFAGERVRSAAELGRLVRETPVGRSVEIRIRRNGAKQTLSATIEARKNGLDALMGQVTGQGHSGRIEVWPKVNVPDLNWNFGFFGGPRLGVSVEELTPQLAGYFGVKDGKGVLVTEVSAGSTAEKAGLKAGDCIVRVDSTAIESAEDVHRALSNKVGESRDVNLTIVRDRKEQTLRAHIDAPERPHFFPNTAQGRLPQADELEKELAQVRTQAKVLADRDMQQNLESARGELQAQLSQARASVKAMTEREIQLRLQTLKDQGQWHEQLKHLAPEMKELQKRLRQLRDQYSCDFV